MAIKVFPIRMDENTYSRLFAQATRFGLSVTAYIRVAFTERLEKDEPTQPTQQKKGRR